MSWSEPVFAEIAGLLTAEYGIGFPPARRGYAEAAMRRASASVHERGPESYLERLRVDPALLRALIAEVTIGETYFFRDPLQFDVIRETVLPDLAQRYANGEPFRIWSAGCATGEEAYSLAMLIGESGYAERAELLASDASSVAIDTARSANYGSWSFRRDAAAWRARCFIKTGKRWTVAPAFRNVEFVVHNLMQPAPYDGRTPGFDLIVCRNVLLYFERPTFERALRHLTGALAPGGWLLMSPTDPAPPAELELESLATPAGIVYRRPLTAETAPALAAPPPVASPDVGASPTRATRSKRAVPGTRVHASARDGANEPTLDAEVYVARALAFLDMSQPHQAAAAARRALFLDRSLAIAYVTLARAQRLTGSPSAAKRALERGTALLGALPPGDAVRGAGGSSAGTLIAVAAAELTLLIGPLVQ